MLKINKDHLPTLVMIGIFTAVMAIYLTCGNAAHGQKEVKQKQNPVDTIPTYVIRVGVLDLQRSVDSLNIVVSYCGKTLSVDQADQVKELYNRTLSRLLRHISIDSTTVPKTKK